MDPDKLSRIYEKISLSNFTTPTFTVETPLQSIGEAKIRNLVGKILLTRPVNREGFHRSMDNIWSTKGDVSIESLGENRFIFHFTHEEDKHRIWIGGPWHCNRSLMELEEPKGIEDISNMKFNKAIFWAQIHKVLIACRNEETALFLGKRVGVVKEIDLGKAGDCLGKFIRVIVEADVSKPLEIGFFIDVKNSNLVMVYVMYE